MRNSSEVEAWSPRPERDIETALAKESVMHEAISNREAAVFIHELSVRNESNPFPLAVPRRYRVLYRIVPEESIVSQENRNQRERWD
jgi:hypothetical protein